MPRRDAADLPVDRATRRTAHETVRETLRSAIVNGSLAPGTRLVLTDVAREMEVSVTPVREALRDLATDGLIQLDAFRGAIVRWTSVEEAREVYEMRALLEPEAVRRAATLLSDDDVNELAALQAEMDGVSDTTRWVELNRRLHHRIISAAGSRLMAQTLERLEESAATYVAVTVRSGAIDIATANLQHHALLAALAARDGERAATEMRRHLRETIEMIESAAAESAGEERGRGD